MIWFCFNGVCVIRGVLLLSCVKVCVVRLGEGLVRSCVCIVVFCGMVSLVNGLFVGKGCSLCVLF